MCSTMALLALCSMPGLHDVGVMLGAVLLLVLLGAAALPSWVLPSLLMLWAVLCSALCAAWVVAVVKRDD